MSTFGLPATAIEQICQTLASCARVERAIIYGSRAKGNYRHNSDIDLTLEGSQLCDRDLATLEARLDDLLLPWQIDLSIKQTLSTPALIEEIDRHGRLFYNSRK